LDKFSFSREENWLRVWWFLSNRALNSSTIWYTPPFDLEFEEEEELVEGSNKDFRIWTLWDDFSALSLVLLKDLNLISSILDIGGGCFPFVVGILSPFLSLLLIGLVVDEGFLVVGLSEDEEEEEEELIESRSLLSFIFSKYQEYVLPMKQSLTTTQHTNNQGERN